MCVCRVDVNEIVGRNIGLVDLSFDGRTACTLIDQFPQRCVGVVLLTEIDFAEALALCARLSEGVAAFVNGCTNVLVNMPRPDTRQDLHPCRPLTRAVIRIQAIDERFRQNVVVSVVNIIELSCQSAVSNLRHANIVVGQRNPDGCPNTR